MGGVIRGASAGGASEDTIQDLFGQAREGVAKGIGQARKDLGQWLNDEISQGIDKSEALIGEKIGALEEDIPGVNTQPGTQRAAMSLSQQQQRSGDLMIRTRDGDEVSIRFKDLQHASYEGYQYQRAAQNPPLVWGSGNTHCR